MARSRATPDSEPTRLSRGRRRPRARPRQPTTRPAGYPDEPTMLRPQPEPSRSTRVCWRPQSGGPPRGSLPSSNVIDGLAAELGGLEVFVNSAGSADKGALMETTLTQWRHTVFADLDGVFVCIEGAARRMIAAGCGSRFDRRDERALAPARGRLQCLRCRQTRPRTLDQDGRSGTGLERRDRQRRRTGRDRHSGDRVDRHRTRPGESTGRPARPPGHAWEIADVIAFRRRRRPATSTGLREWWTEWCCR
jgi:enoyl-ACP reductase-like protein